MEAPTFVGCVVKACLVGVIEAKQKDKDGEEERNDRLIAGALLSSLCTGSVSAPFNDRG
jgi:hypothetical protein